MGRIEDLCENRHDIIRDDQKRFNAWLRKQAGPATATSIIEQGLVMAEEAGEVARCIIKKYQGIRTDTDWDAELAKELGDVYCTLLGISELAGIDLQTAVNARINDLVQRDWSTDRMAAAPVEVITFLQLVQRKEMTGFECRVRITEDGAHLGVEGNAERWYTIDHDRYGEAVLVDVRLEGGEIVRFPAKKLEVVPR